MATRWAKKSDDAIDAAYAEYRTYREAEKLLPPRDREPEPDRRRSTAAFGVVGLFIAVAWLSKGDADPMSQAIWGLLGLFWFGGGARAALSLYRERRDRRAGTSAVENDPSRRPSP